MNDKSIIISTELFKQILNLIDIKCYLCGGLSTKIYFQKHNMLTYACDECEFLKEGGYYNMSYLPQAEIVRQVNQILQQNQNN